MQLLLVRMVSCRELELLSVLVYIPADAGHGSPASVMAPWKAPLQRAAEGLAVFAGHLEGLIPEKFPYELRVTACADG